MDTLLEILKRYGIAAGLFGGEGAVQTLIADGISQAEKILKQFDTELDIGADDFQPLGSVFYWDRIYKSIKDSNQLLGIAGNMGGLIEKSFKGSLKSATEIGASWQDVAKSYERFIEDYGKNKLLSETDFVRLAEFEKVFGKGAEKMLSAYTITGLSIERGSIYLQRLTKEATQMGLNAKVVTDELERNIDALDRLSFKNGVKGLNEMAKLAVRTRISMQSAVSFADKLWEGSLEGAIETSAQLQLLGGQFGAMGDPMELFYLARNSPEELQKRIASLTQTVGQFNRATGEFEVNPLGMSQLRELSKITSIDLKELTQSAKNASKELQLKPMLSGQLKMQSNFDEILSKVASVADYDMGLGKFTVQLGNVKKGIEELTLEDIGQLDVVSNIDDSEVYKQLITSNENLTQTLQRVIDTFKVTMISDQPYQMMTTFTDAAVKTLRDGMESSGMGKFMSFMNELQGKSVENFIGRLNMLGDVNWSAVGSFIMTTMEGVTKVIQGVFDLLVVIKDTIVSIGYYLGAVSEETANRLGGLHTKDTDSPITDAVLMSNPLMLTNAPVFKWGYDKMFGGDETPIPAPTPTPIPAPIPTQSFDILTNPTMFMLPNGSPTSPSVSGNINGEINLNLIGNNEQIQSVKMDSVAANELIQNMMKRLTTIEMKLSGQQNSFINNKPQ